MKPTCSRRSFAMSSDFIPAVDRPQTRTVPLVGDRMHPSMERSVVLPLPDGPISRATSPPARERLTPLRACT